MEKETDLGAQMPGVAGNSLQRGRAGLKHPVVTVFLFCRASACTARDGGRRHEKYSTGNTSLLRRASHCARARFLALGQWPVCGEFSSITLMRSMPQAST